ncbi:MAG: nuclear transport factor 2 family protein [Pseudonocardiaceae bacterium]|nr:MAG: nuclear transport factor 2 family protein [Pseudonocardiaceae bacterium]
MSTSEAAVDVAHRYLTLCSDGHTDEAAALLAPGASIVFPGGVAYSGPADQVEHGRMLYRRVDKDIERVDVYRSADDVRWCVIINGTLNGEASDGSAFAGVRFIDRFGVRDGLIDEHHVWNDLAAVGVVASFTVGR